MTARRPSGSRAGFTLIELLVVVGVIVTLLAIGLTAGNAALTSAKRSATERLFQAISQGLEQFRADHGYLPPLLNPDPSGAEPGAIVSEALPNAFTGGSQDPVQRVNFHSGISLTAYLIGVGDLNADGIEEYTGGNPNLDDGVNGVGLRAPGADKSWGGAVRRPQPGQTQPQPGRPLPPQEGRVYGPYVNLSDSKAIRRISTNDVAADRLHLLNRTSLITDRWGNAIRYYRHLPTGAANNPSLASVPAELLSADAAKEFVGATGAVSATIDTPLLGAEYVLLSAGPDGLYGERESETVPVDPQTPRYLTAAGATGIGVDGPLSSDAKKRVLRRISENLRFIP